MTERENFHQKTDKGGVNSWMVVIIRFNYNFKCDWIIELPDNKLSDNILARELVENRSF